MPLEATGEPPARQASSPAPRALLARTHVAPLWMVPLLLAAIAAVGALDAVTGRDITLTPLYVPIVIVAAWRAGRLASSLCALGCATILVLSDHAFARPFGAAQVWNVVAHLSVYLVVGLSVSKLRDLIRERDRVVAELREALEQVRTLEGLLPICAWCKRIRDEEHGGSWLEVEKYVAQRTAAEFTHGICPHCAAGLRATATLRDQ